ncbi:uncharacterized protein LOC124122788 [Haliotis rufescens]|uniref:uncharacterized protein LOC124122788 n=1 Tax=Haliotis rufescens TaxID=6454 RepID=UPI00201ECC2A|nr:uncharacterized protein LOC124122788 [Haliotis rufescens]
MCDGGSGTCPWDTGLCSDGCQSGWTGEDCTQSVVSSLSPVTSMSPAGAGIIGSLTMLVVLVMVVGVVCLWRKGDFRITKNTPRQNSRTPETSPAPPVELPTYDVLPDQDYTKLNRVHTEHYETLQPTVDYQNSDVRI